MGWARTESDDNEMTWSEEGNVVCRRITFEETAGAGVYTETVAIPAGGVIHSLEVETTATWDATTTLLDLGYTGSLQAWEAASTVDATGFRTLGWSNGGYMLSPSYFAAGTTVTAAITTTGAGGSTGRTTAIVVYSVPPAATEATKA